METPSGRLPPGVDQLEVIEHSIVEGRRLVPSSLLPLDDLSTVRETHETRVFRAGDERLQWTGEQDVSRDASILHHSAVAGNTLLANDDLAALPAYGYNVHEVQTSDGGVRVVETHGTERRERYAPQDRSFASTVVTAPTSRRFAETSPEQLASRSTISGLEGAHYSVRAATAAAASVPPPPPPPPVTSIRPLARASSWKQIVDSDDSLVRKDSYRHMQHYQEKAPSRDTFAPRSQQSLVSRSARGAEAFEEEPGCWDKTKAYLYDIWQRTRAREWTPRLLAQLLLILLLLLLFLLLLFFIIRALFNRFSTHSFLLYPPVCEECRRKNPNALSTQLPSILYVHYYSGEQAHLELQGNLPFKSNSFTAVDFETGWVAVADHALTDSNGRHTSCFLLPLDRSALPDMDSLMDAVKDSDYEVQAEFGWQEFWQWEAELVDTPFAASRFSSPIADCASAKWYQLKQTVYTRDSSCSYCYDFCLPDYDVQRKRRYDDEMTIGIRRLNCLRLYVPEWKQHEVVVDPSGGHWRYPQGSTNTRRDSSGEWVSWNPNYRGTRSM